MTLAFNETVAQTLATPVVVFVQLAAACLGIQNQESQDTCADIRSSASNDHNDIDASEIIQTIAQVVIGISVVYVAYNLGGSVANGPTNQWTIDDVEPNRGRGPMAMVGDVWFIMGPTFPLGCRCGKLLYAPPPKCAIPYLLTIASRPPPLKYAIPY
jgi:hypothetical protein